MLFKLLKKNTLRNLARKSFIAVSFILFIFLTLINFTGCGIYSFTGASVPAHIKTISIPIADDRSGAGEPNLRETFTQSLIQKFIDDNTIRVTDRADANAVLECKITGFSDAPSVISASTTGESVSTRRITISVLVTYRDLVMKKNIYEKTFTNYGDYNPLGSLADRTNAISTAIDKLTDDILLDTVSGW